MIINFRKVLAALADVGGRLDLGTLAAMIAVGWGTQHLGKVMHERVEAIDQLSSRHELAKAGAVEWEGRWEQARQAVMELQESATAKASPDVVPERTRPSSATSSVIGRGEAPTEG